MKTTLIDPVTPADQYAVGGPTPVAEPEPGASARTRRARRWIIAAATTVAVLATVGWVLDRGTSETRLDVVVATRNLPIGHPLVAADLTVAAVPVGGDRGQHLLPSTLIGLIPGEYLTSATVAGAPLRDDQIRPVASVLPVLAEPSAAVCDPQS